MRTYYVVMSDDGDPDGTGARIETIRTSKGAAEQDVRIFADIVRKHTWIQEVEK